MKKFTLIELIIVVAIIGILVTLLLPSLTRARNAAKLVVCLSNTKQLGVASQVYLVDNNNRLARGAEGSDYVATFGAQSRGVTFLTIAPYLGLSKFYYGSFSSNIDFANKRDKLYNSSQLFRCPSMVYDKARLVDYSVNSLHFTEYYATGGYVESGYIPGKQEEMIWPTRLLNKASETILFGENARTTADFNRTNIQFYAPSQLPWNNNAANSSSTAITSTIRLISYYDERHQGKTTMTAFDGSGKSILIKNQSEWSNNFRLTGK